MRFLAVHGAALREPTTAAARHQREHVVARVSAEVVVQLLGGARLGAEAGPRRARNVFARSSTRSTTARSSRPLSSAAVLSGGAVPNS